MQMRQDVVLANLLLIKHVEALFDMMNSLSTESIVSWFDPHSTTLWICFLRFQFCHWCPVRWLLIPWPLPQPPGPAQKGSKHKINSEFEHSPLRSTGRPCFQTPVEEYCGESQKCERSTDNSDC